MAILWTQKQDVGPAARFLHGLAFDPVRQRVLCFGGTGAGGRLGDTWLWDGELWTQVADTGPGPRSAFALATDLTRGRVTLFGGAQDSGLLADTWEWDGVGWTQVADTGPDARSNHAMAYDTGHQRMVLFGGYRAPKPVASDTWGWDGTEWTQLADTGPSGRLAHQMAYDPTAQRVLLHGGDPGSSATWSWDGVLWTQVADTGPGVFDGAMAFNGEGVELCSGVAVTGQGPSLGVATWEWDGHLWTERQDMGPGGRSGAAMTADPMRGAMVIFGGNANYGGQPVFLGDTWEHAATIGGPVGPGSPPELREMRLLPVQVTSVAHESVQITVLLLAPAGPGDVVVTLDQTGGPLMVLPGGMSQSTITIPAGQVRGGLQTTTIQMSGQYDFKATLGFSTIVRSLTAL